MGAFGPRHDGRARRLHRAIVAIDALMEKEVGLHG
jgi:hypothetical protein